MELVDVVDVRHVRDYVVWLRFEDGSEGEVDLRSSLRGPVFEPLHEVEYFKQVRVDPELGTITWPNGADIAPETLYARVTVAV
ncbi:MAG TPA: DUF2442 domain-containing protein [Thermoanaerobaculia bacterium]|nr:DUF2442 domain-containing protein [Thermoanaerobaculia bacterium]